MSSGRLPSRDHNDFFLPIQWDDAQNSVLEFLDKLEKIVRGVERGSLSISHDTKMIQVNPVDSWRILSNTYASGGAELCVRNIITSCVKGVEESSGFAGWITLLTCVEGLKRHIR